MLKSKAGVLKTNIVKKRTKIRKGSKDMNMNKSDYEDSEGELSVPKDYSELVTLTNHKQYLQLVGTVTVSDDEHEVDYGFHGTFQIQTT